MKLNQI